MVAADGIIIASPTYYANCTATTQALLERAGYATRKSGNPLARKVGAAVVAVRRGGAIHAFDSINHWFQINEMLVVGSSYWNLGIGLDKGDVEQDDEGMETMVDARTHHGLGAAEAQRLTAGRRRRFAVRLAGKARAAPGDGEETAP